jgi:hypothetical protein
MALQMNLDNYGEGRVAPGRAHLEVKEFQEYGEPKSGSHVAVCEILAHDDPEQVGKTFKDFIPDPARNAKAVFRLVEFCVGTGLITREEIKQHQANGTAPEVEVTNSNGRQFFAVLVEEEYNGKTNTKIKDGRSYLRVDDPKAAEFPRHPAMWTRAVNAKTNGTPQPSPVAAGSGNPFG